MNRTDALLAEIARTGSTRESIAVVYRDGIREHMTFGDVVDWPTVNAAISRRYTPSGLDYIKALAWKTVRPDPPVVVVVREDAV